MNGKGTPHTQAWDDIKRRRILSARLLLTVMVTGTVFGIPYATATLLPGSALARHAQVFLDKQGPIKAVLDALGYPLLGAFALLAWATWAKTRPWAEHLHDRCLAAFNADVLRRVAAPSPLDPVWGGALEGEDWPALPFMVSRQGVRAQAWQTLWDFATDGLGTGQQPWWSRDTSFEPLRWAVLVGQSGAGKSRLAVHLARTLSRAEELEPGHPTSLSPRARRRLLRAAWLRMAWPPAARHRRDPWDAGWLTGGGTRATVTWVTRTQIEEGWLDRFRKWRPARPTILLLDDPLPNDAGAVVGALNAIKHHFRFPVRLLITAQTMPPELKLSPMQQRDQAQMHWVSPIDGYAAAALLTGTAALTEPELRTMATGAALPARVWQNGDDQVKALARITRGNPLLVELALRQMRLGAPLHGLTETVLVQERAVRIIRALQEAGLGSADQLAVLCVATLAGGEGIANQVGAKAARAAFDNPAFPADGLRRIFSIDRTDEDHIPPVRPERIGDGFVRAVIAQDKAFRPSLAARVARAAWTNNPRAVLRSLPRLLKAGDDLARAIETPPPDTGLDPVSLAEAYAQVAISIPREDFDARDLDDGKAALAKALDVIAQLSPEHALRLLPLVPAISKPPSPVAISRGAPALTIFAAVGQRVLLSDELDAAAADTVVAALADAIEMAKRWCVDDGNLPHLVTAELPRLIEGLPIARGEAGRVLSRVLASLQDDMSLSRSLGTLVLDACMLRDDTMRSDAPGGLRWRAQRAALAGDEIDRAALFSQAMALDPATISQADLPQLAGAYAWLAYYPDDPELAETCLRRIEALRGGVTQDGIAVDRELFTTYCRAAEARIDPGNPDAIRVLIECFDAAVPTSAMPGNPRSLERIRLQAALIMALANCGRADAALEAARELDGIIGPSRSHDRRTALQRAMARSAVAVAFGNQYRHEETVTAVEGLGSILDPDFTGEAPFERSRAHAQAAFANANTANGQVEHVLAASRSVDRTIDPMFSGNLEFEIRRIECQAALVSALANAGRVSEAERACLGLEERIGQRFKGRSQFEISRAQARRSLAFVHRTDDVRYLAALDHLWDGIPEGLRTGAFFVAQVTRAKSFRPDLSWSPPPPPDPAAAAPAQYHTLTTDPEPSPAPHSPP